MIGFISFIDILGYQSFLENNSATESAENVLRLVTEIPGQISRNILDLWKAGPPVQEDIQFDEIEKHLSHLIFSDTIVLFYPLGENTDEIKRELIFMAFALITRSTVGALFATGLPARCALHMGEYMQKEHCLAGRGIVEAHNLCSKLNFSGAVLSTICASMIEKMMDNPRFSKPNIVNTFVKYLAPLKGALEEKLICLNWFETLTDTIKQRCRADVIQFVVSSFWEHEKDAPLAVDDKIRNTCKLLRKFILIDDKKAQMT